MRNLLPVVLIIGLGASLLIGWAIAYAYDRRQRERDEFIHSFEESSPSDEEG